MLHVSLILLTKLLHSYSTFKTSSLQSDIRHYQMLFVPLQILPTNNKVMSSELRRTQSGVVEDLFRVGNWLS